MVFAYFNAFVQCTNGNNKMQIFMQLHIYIRPTCKLVQRLLLQPHDEQDDAQLVVHPLGQCPHAPTVHLPQNPRSILPHIPNDTESDGPMDDMQLEI